MSETREKRTRQLTIKGQTMFDEQQKQLKERYKNFCRRSEKYKGHLSRKSYKEKCKYHNYMLCYKLLVESKIQKYNNITYKV
jgi:hypothetical protein